MAPHNYLTTVGGDTMTLTALASTMALNTLVTGLIVFKILKVYTSIERTLGSAAGTPNYQRLIFIIIEYGMALFAIHLVRIVFTSLFKTYYPSNGIVLAFTSVVYFHQMLNVIIRSVHFYSFVLLISFTWLGHRADINFGAGRNGIVLR